MTVPPLQIPPEHVDGFTALAALADSQFEELRAALATGPSTLDPAAFTETASVSMPTVDPSEALRIIRATISLDTLRRLRGWQAADIGEAVAASSSLEIDDAATAVLPLRVTAVLDSQSLRVMGKAIDVLTDHDRVFLSARALTDIRPVFGDDPGDPPDAVVFSQTLKIDYLRDDGTLDNFYVALDEDDVDTLVLALERAKAKAATLREVLGQTGLTHLRVSGTPHEDPQ